VCVISRVLFSHSSGFYLGWRHPILGSSIWELLGFPVVSDFDCGDYGYPCFGDSSRYGWSWPWWGSEFGFRPLGLRDYRRYERDLNEAMIERDMNVMH
jgi:hypothetical protein